MMELMGFRRRKKKEDYFCVCVIVIWEFKVEKRALESKRYEGSMKNRWRVPCHVG
jgi:hypothetical protein